MTIKTLKARILRALKSSLPAAGGADGAAPAPPSARQYHGDVDALSDDASFFDAREPETPTKAHRRRRPSAEPLDAWELVDPDQDQDQDQEDARASPDPLLGFPRGGGGSGSGVVLYTTTLRGVRRTFEDCNGVRALLEGLGARFQERDVSMDRGLRDQLWAAAGERAVPPRLFVRGRDLGGAARVLALHEEGRLAPLLPLAPAPAPVTRGGGTARLRCGACAGLGFVVCGACDGSRKALQLQGGRCQGCNENGLVMCALCS
jgi:glutaredoxin domain-containing cysteine-rich protein 1